MARAFNEFVGRCKHETDDALLLDLGEGKAQHWLPFSQIDKITRFKDGTVKVVVSKWLAQKINGDPDEDGSNPADSDFGKPPKA